MGERGRMGEGYFFLMLCCLHWQVRISCWFNADEDNTLGVSVQTIKRNTESLMVASKEIGLEQ